VSLPLLTAYNASTQLTNGKPHGLSEIKQMKRINQGLIQLDAEMGGRRMFPQTFVRALVPQKRLFGS